MGQWSYPFYCEIDTILTLLKNPCYRHKQIIGLLVLFSITYHVFYVNQPKKVYSRNDSRAMVTTASVPSR